MRKDNINSVERYLKKEALRKGVYVKEVNIPVHNFAQSFRESVVPFLTIESVFKVVERALSACNSLYKDDHGVTRVNVKDSNMPGLVDNKFDLMNAYLLNEVQKTKPLNRLEESDMIRNLCFFVEELSEDHNQIDNEKESGQYGSTIGY